MMQGLHLLCLLPCIPCSISPDAASDWFAEILGQQHIHVHVGKAPIKGRGDEPVRGLVASHVFAPGDIVLRSPVQSLLHQGNAQEMVQGLCGIGEALSRSDCPEYSKMILVLAAEKRRPRRMFRAYLEALREEHDIGFHGSMSDVVQTHMEVLKIADDDFASFAAEMADIVNVALREGGGWEPPLSEDEAQTAFFTMKARSFASPGFGRTLMPGLDFVNHVPDNATVSFPNCGKEECVIKALRPIHPGEHLSMEYGSYSNVVLAAKYGFTFSPNKWGPCLKGLLPDGWRTSNDSQLAWQRSDACSPHVQQKCIQLQDDPRAQGLVLPEDIRCIFIARKWRFATELPNDVMECLKNPNCNKWGELAVTHRWIAEACANKLNEYVAANGTIERLRKAQDHMSEQLITSVESEMNMLRACSAQHQAMYEGSKDTQDEPSSGVLNNMRVKGSHVDVQVSNTPIEGGDEPIRGLVASRGFSTGEIVLRAPLRAMLYEGNSQKVVHGLCGIGEAPSSNDCPGYGKMILVLVAERRRPRKIFRAYLESLKDEEDFGFYGFSKGFGKPHTLVLKAVDRTFFGNNEAIVSIKSALKAGQRLKPPLTIGEAHWALFTLKRRSFDLRHDGYGVVLMPAFDFANHASDNPSVTFPRCGRNWCEFRALQSIYPGSQILFDYGFSTDISSRCSNVVLFASFGFTDNNFGPALRDLRPPEAHIKEASKICSIGTVKGGVQLRNSPRAIGFVLPEDVRCLFLAEAWPSADELPSGMLECLKDQGCKKWGEPSVTHLRVSESCAKTLDNYVSASGALDQLQNLNDRTSVQLLAIVEAEMNMLRKCKEEHGAIYRERTGKGKQEEL